MDTIVLFIIVIAIFLTGYVWKTDFEKKQYFKDRRERSKRTKKIEKKKNENEGYGQIAGIIEHVGDLRKGNYRYGEENTLSEKTKKFREKYNKGIDKDTRKIINGIEKTQAKNNDKIEKDMSENEWDDYKKENPANYSAITTKIAIVLALLSVVIGVLQLIK